MMKITVDGKELKGIIEKATAAMLKKSSMAVLSRLLIETMEDGKIRVIATDMNQYIELYTDNVEVLEDGKITLNKDDIKLIMKLSDELTITDTQDGKISVNTDKKALSIPCFDTEDFPEVPQVEDKKEVAIVSGKYLRDALVNLNTFTADNENNKIMQCINFNLKDGRMEALDGYRIGMKSLESQKVTNTTLTTFMLLNKAVNVFKKVLDKYSDAEVHVFDCKNHIVFSGKDFTYTQRKVEGEYFRVNRMLTSDYKHRFTVDCKEMIQTSKESIDLIKEGCNDSKTPMILYADDGKIKAYTNALKYESMDEVKAENISVEDGFYIGFNPTFWNDAMKVIDTEKALVTLVNNKAPAFIYGDEYSFLLLPMNTDVDSLHRYLEAQKKVV